MARNGDRRDDAAGAAAAARFDSPASDDRSSHDAVAAAPGAGGNRRCHWLWLSCYTPRQACARKSIKTRHLLIRVSQGRIPTKCVVSAFVASQVGHDDSETRIDEQNYQAQNQSVTNSLQFLLLQAFQLFFFVIDLAVKLLELFAILFLKKIHMTISCR